jgi:hypothetical protein
MLCKNLLKIQKDKKISYKLENWIFWARSLIATKLIESRT